MMQDADGSEESGKDGGALMYSPTTNDGANKKKASDIKKDLPVIHKEPIMKKLAMESSRSKSRTARRRQQEDADDDGVGRPTMPGRNGPLYSPASTRTQRQTKGSSKGTPRVEANKPLEYTPVTSHTQDTRTMTPTKAGGKVGSSAPKKSSTFVASSLAMDVLNRSEASSADRGATIDNNDVERGLAAEPSPALQAQQPPIQPTPAQRNPVPSAIERPKASIQEVTATAVDEDEEAREMQERIDREIEEKLARQLAEANERAEVAEVVTGFWCNQRMKIITALCVALAAVAVILATVLPRALQPSPVTLSPTVAPTSTLQELSEFLSLESLDGGNALRMTSTPQNDALNWLAKDPNLESYSDKKKIQRYAVATLYYSTDGENWDDNSNWLVYIDECDWYYQSCMDSLLVNIILKDNNLEGTIPEEIALLSTSLTKIDFGENDLNGTVPSGIGLLTNLDKLDLGDNDLTGTIPSEIGLLTGLELLHVRNNDFRGAIPSEFGLLTRLVDIDFHGVVLTGSIPSEIGLMAGLDKLILVGYNFKGTIPPEIGFLNGLRELSLSKNSFTGPIPSEIGLMTSLTLLRLSDNSFTGTIPTEIGLMSSLRVLRLSNNDLRGTLPSEIGLRTSFGGTYYNAIFDLSNNSFTGSIPSEIGLVTALDWLYLNDNSFSGSIPTELGLMTSLNELYLSNNRFAGTIPSEISFLTSLYDLYLSNNNLAGTIPPEIGLMESLRQIYLSNNTFRGTIPTEIGLLTWLDDLVLSNNNFTGTIPSEIGLLSDDLVEVILANNSLTGTIPSQITLLTRLDKLNLSYNSFTGTVPSKIALLNHLDEFYLLNNSFSGDFMCPVFMRECYLSCFDQDCEYDTNEYGVGDCPVPQDNTSSCRSL